LRVTEPWGWGSIEKTRFTVLSERAELSGEVLRDAGTLAVTELPWG
jgi:hypothetical protein